jgi:hypothetical protein
MAELKKPINKSAAYAARAKQMKPKALAVLKKKDEELKKTKKSR